MLLAAQPRTGHKVTIPGHGDFSPMRKCIGHLHIYTVMYCTYFHIPFDFDICGPNPSGPAAYPRRPWLPRPSGSSAAAPSGQSLSLSLSFIYIYMYLYIHTVFVVVVRPGSLLPYSIDCTNRVFHSRPSPFGFKWKMLLSGGRGARPCLTCTLRCFCFDVPMSTACRQTHIFLFESQGRRPPLRLK